MEEAFRWISRRIAMKARVERSDEGRRGERRERGKRTTVVVLREPPPWYARTVDNTPWASSPSPVLLLVVRPGETSGSVSHQGNTKLAKYTEIGLSRFVTGGVSGVNPASMSFVGQSWITGSSCISIRWRAPMCCTSAAMGKREDFLAGNPFGRLLVPLLVGVLIQVFLALDYARKFRIIHTDDVTVAPAGSNGTEELLQDVWLKKHL